jgi:hypothetical protein
VKWVLITSVGGIEAMMALEITQRESGRTIEVKPQRVTEQAVTFEYQSRQVTLPLAELDAASRERLSEWQEEQVEVLEDRLGELHEAMGLELFAPGRELWDEPVGTVGARLGWHRESRAESAASFRKYPRAAERLFGARYYCASLYGDADGRAESLSIVFANKGDFGSTAGFGEDHFNKRAGAEEGSGSLDQAIEADAERIAGTLTGLFGEGQEQRYGEKEDRRDVRRWDRGNHSFLLSAREGEYAHLLIVPRALADAGGRIDFVKDSDLMDRLAANVVREGNGDVRIANIPMVNQGPKGYCAPATFERAMRYMFVPADMYLLATLATERGGGTNTRRLAEEAIRIIRSKARRIRALELEEDLDLRLVSRYIDKGVPILWQMASLDAYNELANRLTRERGAIEDHEAWSAKVGKIGERALQELEADSNHHICLIIGYNEKTGELAVSDSWGPRYELRWIPLGLAQAVTTRGGYVIDL